MHKLAKLSAQERHHLVGAFLDAAFGAPRGDGAHAGIAAGLDPASPEAGPYVTALAARYARLLARPDDADLRHRLLTRLEDMNAPRRERYFQLLAVVNGWPAPEPLSPALDWAVRALRATGLRSAVR